MSVMLSKKQLREMLIDDTLGPMDKGVFLNDIAYHYPPILDVKHVKEILNISTPTALRICAEARETKVFPVAKTAEGRGGRWRIPRDAFLKYAFLGEIHPMGLRALAEQLDLKSIEKGD